MRRLTISVPPCATSRAIYASNTGALSLRADSRGFAAQCSAQQRGRECMCRASARVSVARCCRGASHQRRTDMRRRIRADALWRGRDTHAAVAAVP